MHAMQCQSQAAAAKPPTQAQEAEVSSAKKNHTKKKKVTKNERAKRRQRGLLGENGQIQAKIQERHPTINNRREARARYPTRRDAEAEAELERAAKV